MKKSILLASSLIIVSTMASAVFANTSSTMMNNTKPCKNIRTACLTAGYTKHGKTGKNLFADCVKPIIAGQNVTNVTVDANDVQACQAKMAKHMKKSEPTTQATPTT